AAIGRACGLPVTADARLREVDVGSWAGLSIAQMLRDDPAAAAADGCGDDYRRSPTGETASESGARAAVALKAYAEAFDDDLIAVVGHGQSLKLAAFFLMGLDYAASRCFHVQSNCGWMAVAPGRPHWRMLAYNRVA
ncbi:MAG: histidine phosphatase family protein, partial [Propionibacteriaceae bacterium]|nr:histidine phosphatase family protein [Propionibacteriaceae bacterium]